MARHRHGRVKASADDIKRALTGNWRDEYLFVLAQSLAMYDGLAHRVAECDARIEALLAPLGCHEVKLAGPGKRAGENTPGFDLRKALARWAGVDLTRINGLAVTSADDPVRDRTRLDPLRQRQALLLMVGPVPGHQGQRWQGAVRAHAPLEQPRSSGTQARRHELSRNSSALGAFYRRMCARMDKARANTAVAHKLARMIYFMVTRGEDYVDQGQQKYEEQQRQRSIAALRAAPRTSASPSHQMPCLR